jgi:hypothetical protein
MLQPLADAKQAEAAAIAPQFCFSRCHIKADAVILNTDAHLFVATLN